MLADGKIAFMGATANALDFFNKLIKLKLENHDCSSFVFRLGYKCPKNYSPSDFFIKTLAVTPGLEEESRQAVKQICNHFSVSDYARELDVVVQYEFHMGRANEVIK